MCFEVATNMLTSGSTDGCENWALGEFGTVSSETLARLPGLYVEKVVW